MNPNQLALQHKDEIERGGMYVVRPDGSVVVGTGPLAIRVGTPGDLVAPWNWAQQLPSDVAPFAMRIPASDPRSAWYGMYGDATNTGPFHDPPHFDPTTGQYTSDIAWGNVLGDLGAGGILGAGAAAAIGGGGGGAAAGGAAADSGNATLASMAPGAEFGGATSGTAAGSAGLGTKLATTGGNAVLKQIMGSNTSGGSNTAQAMAILGGLLAGKYFGNQGAQANVPPQLSQLLDLGTQRAVAQQPTFNAVNQGIFKMLPTYATQGVTPPSPMTFTPSASGPSPSGSGMNPWLAGGLGAAGGIGLGGLLTGTNPYGSIVDGLKKLFGGDGTQNANAAGGLQIPGGEFDPNTIYGGGDSMGGV